MMTAVMVFIAFAFGLMLFSSLQKDIPDELAFLRVGPNASTTTIPGAKVQEYKGWTITQHEGTVELVKHFNGPLMVDGVAHTSPWIGVLCNNNQLDTRVETHLKTTGIANTPVSINGSSSEEWQKGTGTNIFPPDASKFLRAITGVSQARVTLSYRTLGLQESTLDTAGLPELLQRLPANCRP